MHDIRVSFSAAGTSVAVLEMGVFNVCQIVPCLKELLGTPGGHSGIVCF